ncbi:MAG: hypothetical protein ACTSO3_00940 [Candidatus Heimdallarchaeaceae archaeon]
MPDIEITGRQTRFNCEECDTVIKIEHYYGEVEVIKICQHYKVEREGDDDILLRKVL